MTWTATERTIDPIPELDGSWRPGQEVIDIRDERMHVICFLACAADDPAALEQMRARARLIVQAEAMLDLITDMQAWPVEPPEGSYAAILVQRARAIIAATEGDHG